MAMTADRRISRALKEDASAARRAIKLLLLGAGECGKSTILKQFKILHSNGFTAAEKAEAVDLIHQNTLSSIQALCQAAFDLQLGLEGQDKADANTLLCTTTLFPSPDSIAIIGRLYASAPLQAAMARSSEFYLLDSAPYFLSPSVLSRTLSSSYLPTDADILRSRLATSGIIENEFVIDKLLFRVMDVGGQRGERKKWMSAQ